MLRKRESPTKKDVKYTPIDPDGVHVNAGSTSGGSTGIFRRADSNRSLHADDTVAAPQGGFCCYRQSPFCKILLLSIALAIVLTTGSEYLLSQTNGLRKHIPFANSTALDLEAKEQAIAAREKAAAEAHAAAAEREKQVLEREKAAEAREKAIQEHEQAAANAAAAASANSESPTDDDEAEHDNGNDTEAVTQEDDDEDDGEDNDAQGQAAEQAREKAIAESETANSESNPEADDDEAAVTEEDDSAAEESESTQEKKEKAATNSAPSETDSTTPVEETTEDGDVDEEEEEEEEEVVDASEEEQDLADDWPADDEDLTDDGVEETPDTGEDQEEETETETETTEVEAESNTVVDEDETAEDENEEIPLNGQDEDESANGDAGNVEEDDDEEETPEEEPASGQEDSEDKEELPNEGDEDEDEDDEEAKASQEEESGQDEEASQEEKVAESKPEKPEKDTPDKTGTIEQWEVDAWNRMSNIQRRQIENFRVKNRGSLLLNVHITHQGRSAMCKVLGTGAGSAPDGSCVDDRQGIMPDPPDCHISDGDAHTDADPPFCYSFREMMGQQKPWLSNQTAPFVDAIGPHFRMVTWDLDGPVGRGKFDKGRTLHSTNWNYPRLVSVLVTRNPLARLLAADYSVEKKFPGFNEGQLSRAGWWDYAVYKNRRETDNFALRILSTTHRPRRNYTQDHLDNHVAAGTTATTDGLLQLFPNGIDETHFNEAKAVLDQFTFVLDIECLAEGMERMGKMLRMGQIPPQDYAVPTHFETPKERIGYDDVYEYLRAANEWDIKLYEYSKTISLVKCEDLPQRPAPVPAQAPTTITTEIPTAGIETAEPTHSTAPPTFLPTDAGNIL